MGGGQAQLLVEELAGGFEVLAGSSSRAWYRSRTLGEGLALEAGRGEDRLMSRSLSWVCGGGRGDHTYGCE